MFHGKLSETKLILEQVQTTLTIPKATPFSFKIVPYFKCKQVIFYRGPFKYYVIMFLTFFDPPTSLMIYSTVNHQKLPFSDPTHPPL